MAMISCGSTATSAWMCEGAVVVAASVSCYVFVCDMDRVEVADSPSCTLASVPLCRPQLSEQQAEVSRALQPRSTPCQSS